ncbi:MAG: S8 family serine peptidase, partial [Bacteroidales bacterium]|nr:S8 family serine peptidase [Bacteroidales bacterium]
DLINALPYVLSVSESKGMQNNQDKLKEKPFFKNENWFTGTPSTINNYKASHFYDYGAAYNQIHMLNGDVLHDLGFDGEGIIIAVLDAGFLNADNLSAFQSLWSNGQILGYKDFVSPDDPHIFDSHFHGSAVLSTMGANLPGIMVGTAPKASYWLLRSEDGDTENIIEELNWVSAAEFADSSGADIINSSLGYTVFDDPSWNHTYQDMDGNTVPITIGADIAASKGMIVVNSAGNSGSSSWFYIGAPADGDSVFSIGAVDANGNLASFSSNGPTSDGRIKPNVCSQGEGATYIEPWGGTVSSGNGTSFSSPIIAGVTACLWQANPQYRNLEILQAIEQSSSLYTGPNNQMGYGIPDYALANSILTVIPHNELKNDKIIVSPNPFTDVLNINIIDEQNVRNLEILDLSGRLAYQSSYAGNKNDLSITGLNSLLSKGAYFLRLTLTDGSIFTQKIIRE